jgi:hypothetical protein
MRMIPYTMALFNPEMSDPQRDFLEKLAYVENTD